jgi:hypothetical protein
MNHGRLLVSNGVEMSTIIQYMPVKMDLTPATLKAIIAPPLRTKNISENSPSMFGRILNAIFMHAAFANLFVTITNKQQAVTLIQCRLK